MNYDVNWIRYYNLSERERNKIVEAAGRINPKFIGAELNNDLLENITEPFTSHYLPELQRLLVSLKKGNHSLSLLITILICCSLFFGVLLPLLLLLFISKDDPSYQEWVAGVASINAALIFYFVVKFPFLINREVRFI